MSKRFLKDGFRAIGPGQMEAGPSPARQDGAGAVFQPVWPGFSPPKKERFSDPELKEMEAKVLKEAREKGLQIEKEAYEKGFAQGEKDGRQLGGKEREILRQQLQKLLGEIGKQGAEFYRANEEEMIQLILLITRKILKDFPLPPEIIRETLRCAFRHVVEKKEITLRLNPRDFQFLSALGEGSRFPGEGENLNVLADPSITRGGCFLETSYGEVDATLESQLDQISSLIRQKWERPEKDQ